MNANGEMYTNIQGIKNYDKDGDYIDPTTGLAKAQEPARTDYLVPIIADKDKEPLWDGHIYAYGDGL